MTKTSLLKLITAACLILATVVMALSFTKVVYAGTVCGGGKDKNGNTYTSVDTSIDLGCSGKGNAITDLTFAIIRLLSDGVGIVVIASIVVGGIQYTTSAGDPNAAAKAVGRIRSSLLALLIFIFAYAILNYVIPGTFFNT